jgi:raffinose/stachyose/melibiose transport system substrate-binding protein
MRRLIVALSALSLAVAACGGAASPAPSSPASTAQPSSAASLTVAASASQGAPVTITYLTDTENTAEEEAQAKAQVDEFNSSHPDIQVKREAVGADQLDTITQTRLNSGDIDIVGYEIGPQWGDPLVKAGLVADLAPAFAKYGWKTYDWAKKQCTYQGTLACMPGEFETLGLFYNKTWFAQKGFSVPKTMDDLQKIVTAATADGLVPVTWGNQDIGMASILWSETMSNLLGQSGLNDRLCGTAKWNEAVDVKAIDLDFRQLFKAGWFPDVNAITYDDGNNLFFTGKAPMLMNGTWLNDAVTTKPNGRFEPGFFPLPSIDGSPIAVPSGVGSGTYVAAKSAHVDQAIAFLDWLFSDAVVTKWMLPVFGKIPPQPVDATTLSIPQLAKDTVNSLNTATVFGYNINVLTPSTMNDQINTGFTQVIAGSLSPKEQADKMQAAFQKAIAAGETAYCATK